MDQMCNNRHKRTRGGDVPFAMKRCEKRLWYLVDRIRSMVGQWEQSTFQGSNGEEQSLLFGSFDLLLDGHFTRAKFR